jgi:hypothetical protein
LRIREIVFWEVVLILASVLMFRGAWMLLDLILGKDDARLWIIELVLGTLVATISIYAINKRTKQSLWRLEMQVP